MERSSYRYEPRPDRNAELREALTALARQKPRYGYRRLHALLRRRGQEVNVKRVYRLYVEERLMVRRKKRKRLVREHPAEPRLTGPNQEWAMDFIVDGLATGRMVRILSVVDAYTRECLALEADTSLGSGRVTRVLVSEGIIDQPVRRLGLQPKLMHRAPEAIVANVPREWARLALYWHETTTLTPGTRLRVYSRLLGVGRWLHATRPHIDSPVHWTRTLAAEAVAMCVDLKNCEWAHSTTKSWFPNAGSPMGASSKLDVFYALRTFFRDLQHWEILPRSFDPHIAFRVPRSLQALIGSGTYAATEVGGLRIGVVAPGWGIRRWTNRQGLLERVS